MSTIVGVMERLAYSDVASGGNATCRYCVIYFCSVTELICITILATNGINLCYYDILIAFAFHVLFHE